MRIRYKFLIIIFGFLLFVGIGIMTEYRRQIPMQVITRHIEHPLQNPTAANFIALGDFGNGDVNQKKVAELIERLCVENNPDAVLLLGDNFYNEDGENTSDTQWREKFEKAYSTPCLSKVRAYAILGSQDYHNKPHAKIAYTQMQQRWNLPARYYKVSFGNFIDVFAVDTVFAEKCWLSSFCSVDWTREAINNSKAEWRFAIGHYPLLSVGGYKEPRKSFGTNYADAFCTPKIDAFISGHDHSLQHVQGIPKYGSCAIEQFISAAGGGQLQKVDAGAAFAKSTFGAMVVNINGDDAKFAFYEPGVTESIYSYNLKRAQK